MPGSSTQAAKEPPLPGRPGRLSRRIDAEAEERSPQHCGTRTAPGGEGSESTQNNRGLDEIWRRASVLSPCRRCYEGHIRRSTAPRGVQAGDHVAGDTAVEFVSGGARQFDEGRSTVRADVDIGIRRIEGGGLVGIEGERNITRSRRRPCGRILGRLRIRSFEPLSSGRLANGGDFGKDRLGRPRSCTDWYQA